MALSTCCGCCSLQTGTIVIGVLNIIFGCLSLMFAAPFAAGVVVFSPTLVFLSTAVGGGLIAYTLVTLVLGLLLIIGAVKRKVIFVFPSVCIGFGNILISFGFSIMLLVLSSICGSPGVVIFLIILFSGMGLCLQIYLWLVVYFFYQEIITEQIINAANQNRNSFDHQPLV